MADLEAQRAIEKEEGAKRKELEPKKEGWKYEKSGNFSSNSISRTITK